MSYHYLHFYVDASILISYQFLHQVVGTGNVLSLPPLSKGPDALPKRRPSYVGRGSRDGIPLGSLAGWKGSLPALRMPDRL